LTTLQPLTGSRRCAHDGCGKTRISGACAEGCCPTHCALATLLKNFGPDHCRTHATQIRAAFQQQQALGTNTRTTTRQQAQLQLKVNSDNNTVNDSGDISSHAMSTAPGRAMPMALQVDSQGLSLYEPSPPRAAITSKAFKELATASAAREQLVEDMIGREILVYIWLNVSSILDLQPLANRHCTGKSSGPGYNLQVLGHRFNYHPTRTRPCPHCSLLHL